MREGLRGLERAFDAGVTWFDTAPSYGDGNSETLLSQFAASRRQKIQILTKAGILPAKQFSSVAWVKPLARRLVTVLPGLIGIVSQVRPQPKKVVMTGDFIHASLQGSLERLGSDYVDAFVLHEPTVEDVERDDVLRALEQALDRGQARAIGIAGNASVGNLAKQRCSRINVIQFASNPFDAGDFAFSAREGILSVTHSTLGGAARLRSLVAGLEQAVDARKELLALGYSPNSLAMATQLLVDHALFKNLDGVVLMSMFDATHLAGNLSRIYHDVDPRALDLLARVSNSVR